ncbi:phosphatase [Rhizoctonia solani]|uniref:Phosphatase n=1 Tax=Rhizoctonia solani TaxID=456999 RepID=A0A8H7IN49_9AGAM|nr:phosphatase [Rhizoctonia solani]
MNSHPNHQSNLDDSPQQNNRRRLAFIDHLPTFRQYVQDTWLDLLVVICGERWYALGLNSADNASTRQFPIIFREDGTLFILRSPILAENLCVIPIWLDALLAILIPTLFFIIAQIRVRSFYDFNTAFWGLSGHCVYHIIPSLHQNFDWGVSASLPLRIGSGTGFQGIMYDISICSPDANKAHLRDATKSFPSGHTTAAAAGYVYLSLYFNAKMKIFSNERPHFYKLLVFLAPLLGACLIGGVLTVDNSHHWYDVIAGAIIGTIGALSAFRMSYASIWDYRFNHIPLPRPKSAWSPFGTHDGCERSAINTGPKTTTPENFSYATGVPTFPSFAHPREWCPAGAPGDAWSRNELINADANFQRQAHYGA